MEPSAAEQYTAMVRASQERQRNEVQAPSDRWSPGAARFREDPFRDNPTLNALKSFIEPDDTVLDIGGGAGRYLPLATRCREYVNVEPSAGMGAQFEEAVKESGLGNARWLHSDWLGAEINGDVSFVANVIYYVEDVVPFLAKLDAETRRRVMIVQHSVPPVNIGANVFHLVHGFEQPLDPGHRELLPVLWDMDILPEVRVLGPSDFIVERGRFATRDAALASALPPGLDPAKAAAARDALEQHFEEVFVRTDDGEFRRRPNGRSRVLLITWETSH